MCLRRGKLGLGYNNHRGCRTRAWKHQRNENSSGWPFGHGNTMIRLNSSKRERPGGSSAWPIFVLIELLLLGVGGCGSGTGISVAGLQIVQQPQGSTVPLGSDASFNVQVSGGSGMVYYQWYGPSGPISGANAAALVLNGVKVDDGGTYYVSVGDGSSTLQSSVAALRIGPRSPLSGDLRFKQVDSESTIGGYGDGVSLNLLPLQQKIFQRAIAIPLSTGPGCQTGGINDVSDCAWIMDAFNQSSQVAELDSGFVSSRLSVPPSSSPLTDDKSVVTGLDVRQAFDSSALSWITDSSGGGFRSATHLIPLGAFSLSAAGEGQNSRVITAVSLDNGFVSYVTYSWDRDPSTTYESKVSFCTKDTAASAASDLASQGYIITAVGGNDTDGVVLVGTRVAGDTIPRPFLSAQNGASAVPLVAGGYAIVGVMYRAPQGFIAWLGER